LAGLAKFPCQSVPAEGVANLKLCCKPIFKADQRQGNW